MGISLSICADPGSIAPHVCTATVQLSQVQRLLRYEAFKGSCRLVALLGAPFLAGRVLQLDPFFWQKIFTIPTFAYTI
jgi:hypothetical protein